MQIFEVFCLGSVFKNNCHRKASFYYGCSEHCCWFTSFAKTYDTKKFFFSISDTTNTINCF